MHILHRKNVLLDFKRIHFKEKNEIAIKKQSVECMEGNNSFINLISSFKKGKILCDFYILIKIIRETKVCPSSWVFYQLLSFVRPVKLTPSKIVNDSLLSVSTFGHTDLLKWTAGGNDSEFAWSAEFAAPIRGFL